MRISFLNIFSSIAVLAVLASCGGRNTSRPSGQKSAAPSLELRQFPPAPRVPSMITSPQEINAYIVDKFWDEFLDKAYRCDSSVVNGVAADDVESALGRYVTILENYCERGLATRSMESFFKKISGFQEANPSSNVFGFFEKMVEKYLYDPNSPVRDEDLYEPYVRGLSISGFVDEGLRQAYSRDAQMCSLNRVGTKATDIKFTTLGGKKRSLSGVKADYTLLFFSNPGCPACEDVIRKISASGRISDLISSGRLAVVNLYIDLEIDKWRAMASDYPKTWISGYDQDYIIRKDLTYNVRAIPSLYILDEDKTVLMKDAPIEKVIPFLENI